MCQQIFELGWLNGILYYGVFNVRENSSLKNENYLPYLKYIKYVEKFIYIYIKWEYFSLILFFLARTIIFVLNSIYKYT